LRGDSVISSSFKIIVSSEAESSLPWLTQFLSFSSLHEHHARSLSSEGLAGVETSAFTGGTLCILGSLLEEGEVSLVKGRWCKVVASKGVDVLRDFFIAGVVGG